MHPTSHPAPLVAGILRDGILDIRFADPTSRNSFSIRAARELHGVLDKASGKFKAVIFSAEGRVFCSGGNLADYAGMETSDEGKVVNREITAVLDAVAKLQVPTICKVAGDCFGGGVELMSAFDYVFAVPHAYFGLWQRKISLTYGWGGGARLEKRLGASRLRQLTLSAASISAGEALSMGLVDFVLPKPHFDLRVEEHARRIISLPQTPLSLLKSWTAEKEQEIFESLWWNEEHRRVLASRK